MAVIDLWYKTEKVIGPDGKPLVGADGVALTQRVKSKRHGIGKRWRVDIEGAASESFDNKTKAENRHAEIKTELNAGTYVDPKGGEIKVKDAAAKWLSRLVHDKATAERVEGLFRNHVNDSPLGVMPVAAVTDDDLQDWIKALSEVLAGSTIATFYPYLVTFFSSLEGKSIKRSPCTKNIRLPSVDRKRLVIPTSAEVLQLNENFNQEIGPLPLLVAGTGLRPGECFGLERTHIDLNNKKIHVRQQVKRTAAYGVYIGKLKTNMAWRDVDIASGLVDPLARHLDATSDRPPLVMWDRTDRRESKHFQREADTVFRAAAGGPLYHGPFKYPWEKSLRLSGLKPTTYGLHSLRHLFASMLIHNGKSVKAVQLALGHATAMITLDVYTHEWPEDTVSVGDIVNSQLFAS